MPVVATEYQNWPSADLSRALMRVQRGSLSAKVGGVCDLFMGLILGMGDLADRLPSPPSDETPLLAVKF